MNFYHSTHRHYCGIDLHARSLYACTLDEQGDALRVEIPFVENQAFNTSKNCHQNHLPSPR